MQEDKTSAHRALAESAARNGETFRGDELHAAIMNLPCKAPDTLNGSQAYDYQCGHRDARHAAAELVAASSASMSADQELVDVLRAVEADAAYHLSLYRPHVLDAVRAVLAKHKGDQHV